MTIPKPRGNCYVGTCNCHAIALAQHPERRRECACHYETFEEWQARTIDAATRASRDTRR